MASEAPFEKLGQPLETDPPNRSVSVRPSPNETPFSIAHRGMGEWRSWRDVLELNEITDPFNVSERAQRGSITAAADPADLDDLDALAEFGLEHDWVHVSSEAPQAFSLYVSDTSAGFEITASLPGGSSGDVYTLIPEGVDEQDFVEFSAYVEDEVVDVRMSSAAWLVFWFHRTLHLSSGIAPTRNLAILPPA